MAAAMLRQEGFDIALAALNGYDGALLRAAVNQHRPTHVLIEVPPTRLTAAHHTIVDVAEKLFLPVIIVGRYATCQPEQAISGPGVIVLVRGEYEHALLRLFESLRDNPAWPEEIPGVWFNSEEGLIRNEPSPPVQELDSLPDPDREIFHYGRAVAQTGEATFQATRGCANWCAFCLNDWYISLYRDKGQYLRRRGVGRLLDEVDHVTARYDGVRTVTFCDHAFATDAAWVEEFATEYPRRCRLPCRCHVRLNALDQRIPELLARSGCRQVDVEIGSGSSFIREEVLALRTTRQEIITGVDALKQAGLKVRGSVFVGAPYESEVSVEETLDLLATLQLHQVHPRVFYPLPGTRAAEMCAENGWISGRAEENFYSGHSVLDMPSLPSARIDEIFRRYEALLRRRSGRSLRAWWQSLRTISTQPLHLFKRPRRPRLPHGPDRPWS
ncbi:MAG: hypothetical protein AMJ81_00905 [Phycisphaerae bacterium SM23_33]|nr:MAG: hypothetical protein AMJ81_00905 [Phycisphaerae bacterium SM23_33]